MSSSKENPSIVSMSEGPIFHHTEAEPFEGPRGEACIEQISNHTRVMADVELKGNSL